MNTMIISPMQQDYVTKGEFNEFKDEMSEFRDETNQRFIDLKEFIDDGFEATNTHIDNLEIIMNKRFDALDVKLDKRFDSISSQLTSITAQMTAISTQLSLVSTVTNKLADKLL